MKPHALLFPLLLLSLILFSCATNPAMEHFVARKIDRPFVQADGIRTFSAIGNGSYAKDVVGKETVTYPIPLPLYYSFTLFENVAVNGALIPISVDWQIENSPAGYWGLTTGLGFGSSPYFGFYWDPTVVLTRKLRLDDTTASLVSVKVHDVVYSEGGPTTLGAAVLVAGEFQWGPAFWTQAGVVVNSAYTSSYSKIVGAYRYWTDDGVKFEFPLYLAASVNLGRTWDLNGSYTFSFLGRTNQTWEHSYSVGATVNY